MIAKRRDKDNKNLKRITSVAFIIDEIQGMSAGTETQLGLLTEELVKKNYDIQVICLRGTKWLRSNKDALSSVVKVFDIKSIASLKTMLSFIKLVQLLKKDKPDVVITFFKDSNILGVFAGKLAGVKAIISTRRDFGLWLDRKTYYPLALANRFVDNIITNSVKVKEYVREKEIVDFRKLEVIYNGLKIKDKRILNEQQGDIKSRLGVNGKKIVGIVANLRPMKHYPTLLEASRVVKKIRQDIHFVVVGDGRLRSDLESMSIDLGVDDIVHFVGSKLDIIPYLNIFDIGVNCSANEGLSNSIMEYMYFGIPCIVSAAGGNEELIVDGVNGYTFELDNYEKLAKRILELMDDDVNKRKFVDYSFEWAKKNLTVGKMVTKYEKLIREKIRK